RANGIVRTSEVTGYRGQGTAGRGQRADARGGRRQTNSVRVALFVDPARLENTVVAVGCDPATSLLADHLKRRHPLMELAAQGGNSLQALEAVARGEAHLA